MSTSEERVWDAFVVSSDRSRKLLALTVFASVVVLSVAWNTRQMAWPKVRLESYLRCEDYLEATERDPEGSEQGEWARSCTAVVPKDPAVAGVVRRALLERMIGFQEVRIPILGLAVDAKDLGLLSGICFTVMLVWLRFALHQELSNLKSAQEATPARALPEAYRLLSMRQVLTRAPPLVRERGSEPVWSLAIRALFLLPALAQLVVILAGLHTFDTARRMSSAGAWFNLSMSALFLVLSGLATVETLRISREIERTWHGFAIQARAALAVAEKPATEE